jgi:hypothetical protein
LPNSSEMAEIATQAKKDVLRKNSVMLPNGSNSIMDKNTGSSLAAAGSNVIGGIENYKKYQMLIAAQQGPAVGSGDNSNKRS